MSETPDITKQAIQKLGVALNQYVQTIADPYAKTCAMEDINRNLAVVQDRIENDSAKCQHFQTVLNQMVQAKQTLIDRFAKGVEMGLPPYAPDRVLAMVEETLA